MAVTTADWVVIGVLGAIAVAVLVVDWCVRNRE